MNASDDPSGSNPKRGTSGDPVADIGYNPLKETLARAEEATTALRANYPEWARIDVDQAQAILAAATSEPDRRREHLDLVYAAMHNIKGQGASFGYPLVTRIAQSLCKLLGAKHDIGGPMLRVVQAHVDALKLVLDQKIEGPGGETGEKLASRLEALADELVR